MGMASWTRRGGVSDCRWGEVSNTLFTKGVSNGKR